MLEGVRSSLLDLAAECFLHIKFPSLTRFDLRHSHPPTSSSALSRAHYRYRRRARHRQGPFKLDDLLTYPINLKKYLLCAQLVSGSLTTQQ